MAPVPGLGRGGADDPGVFGDSGALLLLGRGGAGGLGVFGDAGALLSPLLLLCAFESSPLPRFPQLLMRKFGMRMRGALQALAGDPAWTSPSAAQYEACPTCCICDRRNATPEVPDLSGGVENPASKTSTTVRSLGAV